MIDPTAATPPAGKPAPAPRTPWVPPRVQTIRAGDAEQGTRMSNQDGGFTTS